MKDPLDSLSDVERGFVLGVALSGGEPGSLDEPTGERCAQALAALRALSREARAARLTRLAAEATVPSVDESRALADLAASFVRAARDKNRD